MKTAANTKRVLLYGDSLVYGKVPLKAERWPSEIRFSGVAQDLLGEHYEIIEEGLRARMLRGENSFFPERNGLEQFGPIIGSHLSFDLLVLALGTNDCNSGSNTTEQSIFGALNQYKEKMKLWAEALQTKIPELVVVIPPAIEESGFDEAMGRIFGVGSSQRQLHLEESMKKYAQQHDLPYLLAREVCEPARDGDGIHLDKKGNRNLGKALAEKIVAIL